MPSIRKNVKRVTGGGGREERVVSTGSISLESTNTVQLGWGPVIPSNWHGSTLSLWEMLEGWLGGWVGVGVGGGVPGRGAEKGN